MDQQSTLTLRYTATDLDLGPATAGELPIAARLLERAWEERGKHQVEVSTTPIALPSNAAPTFHVNRTALARQGDRWVGSAQVSTTIPAAQLDRVNVILRRAFERDHTTIAPYHEPLLRPMRGREVIGPVPDDFPIGRTISGFSTHLGSYGIGGAGYCGWQLDGGSWMILPLGGSSDWIILTRELHDLDFNRVDLRVTVDRRIIGCMPSQRDRFYPWDHRYSGYAETIDDLPDWGTLRPIIDRFERGPRHLLLQARADQEIWRFAISDHHLRPEFGGSKEPRDLAESDDLGASLTMAHSCYVNT